MVVAFVFIVVGKKLDPSRIRPPSDIVIEVEGLNLTRRETPKP
jgi:hypothetical protein